MFPFKGEDLFVCFREAISLYVVKLLWLFHRLSCSFEYIKIKKKSIATRVVWMLFVNQQACYEYRYIQGRNIP